MSTGRIKNIIAAAVVMMSFITLGVGIVHADSSQSVTQGVTNQTVYRAGSTVVVTGVVNGDVYCAGQTVTIDATVNGDVICAGQTLSISGVINGNIRVAGQTITMSAKVTDNATVFGQTISLQNNSTIGGDATIAGQDIQLNGKIGRDVSLAGTKVTLNGSIGRNVTAQVGDTFIVTSNANVRGNVTYTSPKTWTKSSEATISGTTTYHVSQQHNPSVAQWAGWAILWWLFCVLALIVLSLVLVGLFPQLFRRMQKNATSHLGYVILTGFAALFILPSLVIMSFLTVVGFPIGILLLLLWGVLAMVSFPVAIYGVGSRLAPRMHPLLIVLIGALLLGIIGIIPFVGWVVCWIMYVFGSGTILWHVAQSYQKPKFVTKE